MTSRRVRGFTLIETTIALAILAFSLGSLFEIFEGAIVRARHDTALRESTLIAQSLLARAGTEVSAEESPIQGSWNLYTYELRAESNDAAETSTQKWVATVMWDGSTSRQSISISTLKVLRKARQ